MLLECRGYGEVSLVVESSWSVFIVSTERVLLGQNISKARPAWWHTPVIPATWEAIVRNIVVRGQPALGEKSDPI
jgi:hypothetical protein